MNKIVEKEFSKVEKELELKKKRFIKKNRSNSLKIKNIGQQSLLSLKYELGINIKRLQTNNNFWEANTIKELYDLIDIDNIHEQYIWFRATKKLIRPIRKEARRNEKFIAIIKELAVLNWDQNLLDIVNEIEDFYKNYYGDLWDYTPTKSNYRKRIKW